ncbi:uncharacterized protein LOC102090452 isoform X1 [Columba livia]|uniref:uncharacterized protein LOC102090452 isoform X1 n=1 Tax=Columba livia TaxID=8932 RepID=UPI0031BA844C
MARQCLQKLMHFLSLLGRFRTPLKIAAYARNTNVVRLLLQHGAVLSHRDENGFTDMAYLDVFTPGFSKTLHEYVRSKRTGECSVGGAGGAAVHEISSSATTAAPPVGAPAQSGAGVLPEAGAEQEEDFDSLSDFETDSEGPMELLDAVLLPGAKQQGACAHPVAEERHNGVLPAAGAAQEDDDESLSDSETDSEGLTELLDSVLLPGAKQQGACAHPVAEERHNGVLPAAGAAQEEEDFDFSSLDEVLCLPELKELLCFLSPAAERQCDAAVLLRIPLLTVCRSVFLLAQDFALEREELPLKKEASTQTDGQGDTQEWVRWLQQELASALRKCSLAEASLEAEKRHSRDLQEQKLQLQKELDSSKAQLQELKERLIRNECYAESLESAIKNKERELTASKHLQRLLVTSSGTASVPELEERVQQLQVRRARLAATVQQQAKTMEALQQDLQASASPLLSLQRH